MNFLENIFKQLESAPETPFLRETPDSETITVTGSDLLAMIGCARTFIRQRGLKKGDRCALLAHNSIRWVAMDLALMAEGVIVVPLYARQAPAELMAMMKDCSPSLICCGDAESQKAIKQVWPETPDQCLFDEIFATAANGSAKIQLSHNDPVAIIYTSGTSGEAKGVIINAENVGFILQRSVARLDLLMSGCSGQEHVYHYLPFCFCASWIALLSYLSRRSLVTLNLDLTRLAAEMRAANPDYFLNVPALLERMRKAVDEQLWKTGGIILSIYTRAKAAWLRKQEGKHERGDGIWLALAKSLVFPAIRKKMLGARLKGLISGSAPLNVETQHYYAMLGIPVLQVYGLTETTGICTMDDPRRVVPGRVGPAIDGLEMKLGENQEIIVRGPNVFSGYWNRPQETAKVLRDGWFHTGDQGEVDETGNWRIVGRIKNLIILGSGHNIAPEPIEEKILQQLSGAQQVVLVGNGRGFLTAIITGNVTRDVAQAALDGVNPGLPHYKQIRAFHLQPDAFSVDSGLMTVNGKLRRDAIAARFKSEIEEMYKVKQAS